MANRRNNDEHERVRLKSKCDRDEWDYWMGVVKARSSKFQEEEKEKHCRSGLARFLNLLEDNEKQKSQKITDEGFDRLISPNRKTLNLRGKRCPEFNQERRFLNEDNSKKSSKRSCSEPRIVDIEECSIQLLPERPSKKSSNGPAFEYRNLDQEDGEAELLTEKPPGKPSKRRGYPCRNYDKEEGTPKKKTKKGNRIPVQLPNAPPELPEEFKNIIRDLGYEEEAVLVIQKEVYNSDVEKHLGRFAIPVKQVINDGFLTEEEKARFTVENKNEMIEVVFIDPSLSVRSLNLKKWYMFKAGGKYSCSWVLISAWNEVVKENGLKQGMIVQVWSFREGSQIGFAMVVIQR